MIAPAFLPAYAHGGVPRSSFHLAKGLYQLGHDVRVVASNRNGSSQLDVPADRFSNFQGLPVCYCTAKAGSFLHSPSAKRILAEELRTSDCVLHQGTTWTHFGFLAAQHARSTRFRSKPYVIWPRGVLSPAALSISPIKKKLYWSLCMRNFYARARAIVATTEAEVDQIARMGSNRRIEVIPNAVDTASLSETLTRAELDQHYPQLTDKRIILSLGRLCPIKGLTHLLDAFSQLKKQFDNVALVIAGPDENGYLAQLQSQARRLDLNGSVLFTGRIQGREKVGLLRCSHVLAMPSDSESFGLSAAEAAACGVPIVLTRSCGFAEDAVRAGAGFAVNQDSCEIAKAIRMLLNDKELQKQMGRKGKRLVEDKYSWSTVAGKTDNLIKELIGQ